MHRAFRSGLVALTFLALSGGLTALLPAPPAGRAGDAAGPVKRLVVVAPQRFHPALRDFVRFKQKVLPTELASLEEILRTSPGVDDPERLKRYLYDGWRRRGLGYALLVGDADVLPVRYMVLDRVTPAAFDYAFYPSDLYYSDLARQDGSFDDWNARKEGFHARYFGEVRGEKNKNDPINYDRVDYRPEIAVGRWPVSTAEEAARVAAKSMAYEEAVRRGRHPGLRRAAFLAVGGWVDMRAQMDGWAKRLPAGWHPERRFYAGEGRDDRTPPPAEKELQALLNAGVGLVVHAGHGSDDTWHGCFSLGTLRQVRNADRLPVMISAGCSTATFAPLAPYEAYVDADGKKHRGTNAGEVFRAPPPPPAPYQKGRYKRTGLGGQLVRRAGSGAVAYVGCDTGSQPCALTLVEGFVVALRKSPQPRLGDCWADAVRYYYDKEGLARLRPTDSWYPPSIFFQGMKFVLFGDPTLPLAPSAGGRRPAAPATR
jgi:hypothetical protein